MSADKFYAINEQLLQGEPCPICITPNAKLTLVKRKLTPVDPFGPRHLEVDCPICGEFALTDQAATIIKGNITKNSYLSAVLRYYIRRMQGRDKTRPTIDEKLAEDFLKRDLPDAAEQADNFILWVGDCTQLGGLLPFDYERDYPIVGAAGAVGMNYIFSELQRIGIIDREEILDKMLGKTAGRLTFDGWAKYSVLKKGKASGKKAFMAMPFGDSRLAEVYVAYQTAVAASGFTLEKLDERAKAGLIDNRLRVEIQTSRFVVVDLTHDNNGAYWEGGFAEGLGKTVFYSCEKSYFDGKRTHFDANHLYTVLWEFDKLDIAATELKNAIRATLPDEAKLTDD